MRTELPVLPKATDAETQIVESPSGSVSKATA